MTDVLRAHPVPAATLRPDRLAATVAAARLSWRLVRRGAGLVWLTVAAYLAIEVLVYRQAYPTAASRQALREVATSTAVRMVQGVPGAVDTPGGFAVWDAGWLLTVVVTCWAVLTVTRLTRGEEDAGRAELTLARPLTPREVLAGHLAAVTAAALGTVVAAVVPLAALGQGWAGGLAFGLGLAGLMAVATAVGAVAGQLLQPRRAASGLGLAAVAVAFLVRVLADSSDRRSWLLTVGPFGWVERLHPFAGERWVWLLPPVAAAAVLAAVALVVCGRRDTGAALLHERATHASSDRLLGGPSAFGWRSGAGSLLAWTVGMAVTALVLGLMTGALVEFIERDQRYRDLLASMGVDVSVPAVGYVSYTAGFLVLPAAAFLAWRVGAARQEEASGRLDNLLARGVVRSRWLAATGLDALLAVVVLLAATGVATWAGVRLADAPVAAGDVLTVTLQSLPVVVLFAGLAVLAFGAVPGLTVGLPLTVAVVGYVLDSLGTALSWPGAVVGLSPFHHLARLPAHPMTATAASVLIGLGVAAAVAGTLAFARRDLRGA